MALKLPEAIFHFDRVEESPDSTDWFNGGTVTLRGRLRLNLISGLFSAEVTFGCGWICRLYLSPASPS